MINSHLFLSQNQTVSKAQRYWCVLIALIGTEAHLTEATVSVTADGSFLPLKEIIANIMILHGSRK